MFLSRGAHPHLLTPTDYTSAESFAREREEVFRPGWHCIGTAASLARPGDYVSTEVAGVPVVVRNMDGALRAFVNVCPHRHSLIVRPGCGSAEKLKCQYHGWEFDGAGKLSHLPDGRSFVGFKARDACLDAVRVERFANLVFVSVDPAGGALRDALGGLADDLSRHFDPLDHVWTQVTEHEANWKVIVENAVESYHVPMVHQTTFKTYAEERHHDHRVEPGYTQYHAIPSAPKQLRWHIADQVVFPRLPSWGYSHTHLFPNNLITYSGYYREWVVAVPLSPTRSRRVGYGFLPRDADVRGIPFLTLANRLLRHRTRQSADKILGEDASLWESVQRGLTSSRNRGIIGAREERVAAFQRYLVERRGADRSAPVG